MKWLGRRASIALHGAIAKLGTLLGVPLAGLHERPDVSHTQAAKLVADLPRKIIEEEYVYFRRTVGMDLHIQSTPYLRISRPGVDADNIGMHRDTWYGDTAYEVSVWIPLTDTDEDNALRIAPGSHLWSEKEHPVEEFDSGVAKGSEKHALGFVYAPKRLVRPVETIPVPMRVGQMLIFPVSLLHGVEVNRSKRTRVSMDCRVANSLAPIRMSRSRDDNYYSRMAISPITEIALKYEANQ